MDILLHWLSLMMALVETPKRVAIYSEQQIFEFYICGSVHHQSILLNNQRDAALSSRIYSSLQGYSTFFGCFLYPSSGVQLKLQMQS
jgi:hypothetical protein